MRELIYTLVELGREYRDRSCSFCSNLYGEDNKAVRQIITRIKANSKLFSVEVVCEICEEKYLNGEIPKCDRCGRLHNKTYNDFFSGKYICYCVRFNEDPDEKELPDLPYESQATFYERQINTLQEEKGQLEEEIGSHLDALEISEDWHERQKQELIVENERLKKLNGQTELIDMSKLFDRMKELEAEISKLSQEVKQLKEQLNSTEKLETKIEQSPKNKPWKQLLIKKN